MDGLYASEVDERKSLMVQPLVSFLMSVRNDSITLEKCLESLTQQTYKKVEIVIVLDDANPLAEKKVRIAARDNQIFRVIVNPSPKNLSRSLNLGISNCKGEYIARIDADDICALDRVTLQLTCLESLGADFALVGSRASGLYSENQGDDITILEGRDFNKTNPLIHPSTLVRREILEKFKYNESYRYSQDYELWTRVVKFYKIGILNRELIKFDNRQRDPRYVLTQEFYFLRANLRFLLASIKVGNGRLEFEEISQSLFINIVRQKNLARNWIRLAVGRF